MSTANIAKLCLLTAILFTIVFYLVIMEKRGLNFTVNYSIVPVVHSNNEWIINKAVLQYSIYLIIKSPQLYSIESLLFIDNNLINNDLKCAIWIPKENDYLIIPITRKIVINPPLTKVFCEYNGTRIDKDSTFYGAIIDAKSQNETYKNPYQKVVVIDGTKEKIKSIGHCVHTLRGLPSIDSNKTKMLNYWLQLQKSIGISEVKFYIYDDLNKDVIDYLKNKHKEFVSFVDHRFNLETFCESFNSNGTYQSICKNSKIINSLGYHERLNTNDCYLNFKYKYEMFTNYDIDEIIFPRLNAITDDFAIYKGIDCEENRGLFINQSINLYEYALKMFDLMDSKRTACLMFKNVAFVLFDEYLNKFMETFNFNDTQSFPVIFRYLDEENKGIQTVARNTEDLNRLKFMYRFYEKLKCLRNKKILGKGVDLYDFDRIFAFLSDGRYGKSILNTNLVETVNQHSSDEMSPGTYKNELPLKYGYASHFRDYYKGFYMNRDYQTGQIHLDIEYYIFLLNTLDKNL